MFNLKIQAPKRIGFFMTTIITLRSFERFVGVRGIAVRAGAVLGGFLVLDKRGHDGGGGMR